MVYDELLQATVKYVAESPAGSPPRLIRVTEETFKELLHEAGWPRVHFLRGSWCFHSIPLIVEYEQTVPFILER